MGSVFGGGGGSVQAPNPPKPLKINLQQMQQEMVGADQSAYAAGDAYMSQFYPELTQARDQMIEQAYGALTGPLDPSLQNTFVNTANMQSANALGQGDQSFGLGGGGGAKFTPGGGGANVMGGAGAGSSWGGGTLARNAAAASVASNEQGYQDYTRSLFQNLNSLYAPRAFGMTPEDAANVFTFNNTQMNNYLQQKFAAQTQAYYQSQGAAASQGAATTGLIGGLASSLISGIIAY